jgi:methylated-DNA-protein-cysteine methyltransferase-like protein
VPDGELTPFEADITVVLARLEPGEVVTYGEVAAEAGHPGAGRAVGAHLARHGDRCAWWRVVAASGRLVPGHEAEHARRLRAEGVDVDASAGRVRRFRRG